MQDNGTRLRFRDPATGQYTTTYNQVLGGDGIGVAVSGGFNAAAHVPNVLVASVPGAIFISGDGGQNFTQLAAGLPQLPFFVRVARDASPAVDAFVTIGAAPAGFFRWRAGDLAWANVSGILHWQDSNQDTQGFVTVDNAAPILLRNLATHPLSANVWAAVSNRFTYMTNNGGARWLVGVQPRPPGSASASLSVPSAEPPLPRAAQSFRRLRRSTAA